MDAAEGKGGGEEGLETKFNIENIYSSMLVRLNERNADC